jgi:hypothetical protein
VGTKLKHVLLAATGLLPVDLSFWTGTRMQIARECLQHPTSCTQHPAADCDDVSHDRNVVLSVTPQRLC